MAGLMTDAAAVLADRLVFADRGSVPNIASSPLPHHLHEVRTRLAFARVRACVRARWQTRHV
jgi:hypothetical protein